MSEKPLPMAEIASEYAGGRSAQQLARDYGVSDGTIRARLKREGVTLRTLSQAQSLWQKGVSKSDAHKAALSRGKMGKPAPKPPGFGEHLRLRMTGRVGASHPSWKGGMTSLRRSIVKWAEYKIWRNAVFSRDNWTCQECAKRGGYIQAHHNDRVEDILSRFEVKTSQQALECKALWDVSNGTTLCSSCHTKVEVRQHGHWRSNQS